MEGVRSATNKPLKSYLSHSLLFLVFFSIPVILAFKFSSWSTPAKVYIDDETEEIFPSSFIVAGPGSTLRVEDSKRLHVTASSDYLMFYWIKLRKPLEIGERAVFVGKYDPRSSTRPGYSIGLTRDIDGVRPIVYWQGVEGGGRWFTFSAAEVVPRNWYLLALSFRSGRYLGVHLAEYGSNNPVQLLGGYDLEREVLPDNDADLIVGAFADSRFRGRLGPFGQLAVDKLSDKLLPLLDDIRQEPRKIPGRLDGESIKLWYDGAKDISKEPHSVTSHDGGR